MSAHGVLWPAVWAAVGTGQPGRTRYPGAVLAGACPAVLGQPALLVPSGPATASTPAVAVGLSRPPAEPARTVAGPF